MKNINLKGKLTPFHFDVSFNETFNFEDASIINDYGATPQGKIRLVTEELSTSTLDTGSDPNTDKMPSPNAADISVGKKSRPPDLKINQPVDGVDIGDIDIHWNEAVADGKMVNEVIRGNHGNDFRDNLSVVFEKQQLAIESDEVSMGSSLRSVP